MKNVAVSLMAILFAACSGNKSPHSLQQEKEDLSAKEEIPSTMQTHKVLPLHLK